MGWENSAKESGKLEGGGGGKFQCTPPSTSLLQPLGYMYVVQVPSDKMYSIIVN